MSGISVLSGNVLLENVPETDVPDKKMWIQSVDGLDQGSQLNAGCSRRPQGNVLPLCRRADLVGNRGHQNSALRLSRTKSISCMCLMIPLASCSFFP